MNTIITLFILSFLLSLLLTPYAGAVAKRYGIVDEPSSRKVHGRAVPRIGGAAIFLSFVLPFTGAFVVYTDLLKEVIVNPAILWLAVGGGIVFVLGLWDDIHHLPAWVKLAVQIGAAAVVYTGGLRIEGMILPWGGAVSFSYISVIVTIFWFVLVVNAINLIDGLDGLAAGVVFFTSLVLLILSVWAGRFVVAMGFAALAGSTLGFLRYNFNPASIFMGDGGSYFLGFMLAGLSLMGSVKGQTTVALLIPIIAMGVPLMDTMIAPIRRFVRGRPMFQPDKSHLHHRLMRLGLNHRNTVLVLYGATVILGLTALGTVFVKDFNAFLVLALLGAGVYWAIRKIGYLEYLAVDKIGGYLYDMGDLMGVTSHRRTFLDRQIEIEEAQDYETLWQHTLSALKLLKIDQAEMRINGQGKSGGQVFKISVLPEATKENANEAAKGAAHGSAGRNFGGQVFKISKNGSGVDFVDERRQNLGRAARRDFLRTCTSCDLGSYRAAARTAAINGNGGHNLVVSLPLVNGDGRKCYGILYLEKDVVNDPLAPFTLRRLEHLRRSLTAALKRLEKC